MDHRYMPRACLHPVAPCCTLLLCCFWAFCRVIRSACARLFVMPTPLCVARAVPSSEQAGTANDMPLKIAVQFFSLALEAKVHPPIAVTLCALHGVLVLPLALT
jgi:hypothetical protein